MKTPKCKCGTTMTIKGWLGTRPTSKPLTVGNEDVYLFQCSGCKNVKVVAE